MSDTINQECLEYFNNDELSSKVFLKKYALRTLNGELVETNPDEMHKNRLAPEFARIDSKYNNPKNSDDFYESMKGFKYIVPGGSPMSGIGNNNQVVSISNCFVIGNPEGTDSYGGIMRIDEEMIQLMKRRGGVGTDLSGIRPAGSIVHNSAMTSTGVVPFMERYSNTTREVAQAGRRGALMLSIDIKHPESDKFIDAKLAEGKVTGANVSVKINDDFMNSVKSGEPYYQIYPTNSTDISIDESSEYDNLIYCNDKWKCYKKIDAKKLWDKIIYNAWRSAEPGVLFWDNILNNTSVKPYYDKGFKPMSTNPCGEIPLQPYDSCRLLALNLYSFVNNPFTPSAEVDWDKLESEVRMAVRMLDDIVDLELEKVQAIIDKIKSDPEPESIKRVELELWEKVYKAGEQGRRLGLGTTGDGDALAALNKIYGTEDGNNTLINIHRFIAVVAYMESIDLAEERGSFEIFDYELEKDNEFINRVINSIPEYFNDDKYSEYKDKWKTYGRRNIACLTIAPTGSVSMMTQTSSGFEPVFSLFYQRKRKIDDKSKADFIDEVGDAFEINNVVHHKFVEWYRINHSNIHHSGECISYQTAKSELSKLSESEINDLIKQSPYYKATAQEIDPVMKVKLQGGVQQWIDNSISCTVNLPANATVEQVNDIYLEAYKSGCKGCTIYRDGCRSGVLTTSTKSESTVNQLEVQSRPDVLDAEVIRFKNNDEYWIAYVGILNGKPYEIFTGIEDKDAMLLPKAITKGKILRVVDKKGKKRYDFQYSQPKYGYVNTLGGISHLFNREYWNYARFISGYLRNGTPIENTIEVLESLSFDKDSINSWRNGVIRALKKYVKNGTKSKQVCPECGEHLVYEEGCLKCNNCGYSKCGG